MKFFTNKSIWTKIVIVLIFVILFQFAVARPVQAETGDTIEFGGKLLSPVVSLFVTLADAIMGVMHSSIMGVDSSLQEVELSAEWYEFLGTVFKVVLAEAILAIGICVPGLGALIVGVAAALATMFTGVGDVVFDATMDTLGIKGVNAVNVSSYTVDNLPETLYLPAYSLSPEEIFKGDILLFNVDFFSDPIEIKEEWGPVLDEDGNPKIGNDGSELQEIKSYYYEDEQGNKITTSPQNMAQKLRGTISSWYVGIRNIALVMMMIVLLYIGIRMLLSTLASDKAKYRQMMYDWLVGIVILFLMHYIMAFSVTLVGKLTKVVSTSVDENGYAVIIPDDTNNKLTDYIKSTGNEELKQSIVNEKLETDENGDFVFYPTNLLGKMRLELQLANWGTEYIGYAICFVVLVLFTLFFAFTYIRRVLYMAFLTLMAPLVAVTYPIDKIADGSAQGFNKWFKEYIFNLLIQPMHLLLYYILITSAFNLASENLLYSIVAIGFMLPAEKLLRSFFGFDKANTPGFFAGAAGGALAMQAINKIGALGKGKKSSSGGSSSGSGSSSEDNTTPRMQGDVDATALMSGEDNPSNNSAEEAARRQDKEALEEKIADGQLGENELTNKQKELLGLVKENEKHEEDNNYNAPEFNNEIGNTSIGTGRKARAKRKVLSVAKGMAASAKYKIVKDAKTPKEMAKTIGKGVSKGYIRMAGAGALATMGVAAGVATGDVSNAFSYGTAAGAVGLGLTKNMLNTSSSEQYRAARDSVRNSPEFEELKRKEYMDNFKKDNKGALSNNFSKEEVTEMLKDGGAVEKYLQNGVNDIDDIITAQKMVNSKEVKDIDNAIAVAKYSKRVGKDYNTDKKAKWKETFAEEFQEKSGLNKTNANKAANSTMKKIEKFNKTKKDIYK